MTEFTNPVYGQGDTDLYHGFEAPSADYAFHPTSACGQAVITGDRFAKSDLPNDAQICKACADIISGPQGAKEMKDTQAPKTTEEKI